MSSNLSLAEALQLANQHLAAGRRAEADRVINALCEALPRQDLRDQLRLKSAMQWADWPAAFAVAARMVAGPGPSPDPEPGEAGSSDVAPSPPRPYMGLGKHLVELGEFELAERAFGFMLDAAPDLPEAHFNRAHALLALGRYAEAWPEFEWRYGMEQAGGYAIDDATRMWDGRDLGNGRLLVQTEQGFGDSIQYLRLLDFAAQRCGELLVMSPRPLARLIEWMPATDRVLVRERGENRAAVSAYCPIGRLPCLAEVTVDSIPNRVPYVQVPESELTRWRRRMDASSEGRNGAGGIPERRRPRVGLAWAGNPKNGSDHKRSLPTDALTTLLAPILELDHIELFSFQVGATAARLDANRVRPLASGFDDFGDTAAALCAMDALVTVETSVSHLAAALGVKALVMLAAVPDWRYIHEGARQRWFPTLEFVRQTHPGDWEGVVAEVRRRLLRDFPAPRGN